MTERSDLCHEPETEGGRGDEPGVLVSVLHAAATDEVLRRRVSGAERRKEATPVFVDDVQHFLAFTVRVSLELTRPRTRSMAWAIGPGFVQHVE